MKVLVRNLAAVAMGSLLTTAAQAGWALRLWQVSGAFDADAARLPNMFAFAATLLTAMIAVGVYGVQAIRSVRFAVARLMVAVMLGIILLSLIFFVAPPVSFWRSSLLYAMWFGLVAMTIVRILARDLLGGERFKRRVMVLGAGARAARIEALAATSGAGFSVVGFVGMNDGASAVAASINRDDIKSLPDHLLALPRISVNGRYQRVAHIRTMLSGVTTPLANAGKMLVTV